MPMYWKRGGPLMPDGEALAELKKYHKLGAQLRYLSGPADSDPTGHVLIIPLGLKPVERRAKLYEMSGVRGAWEQIHLIPDPSP
jgi:hypothetical protein